MPKSMLWKVKLNAEDMLSLEISRAAYASLSIEEKNPICQKSRNDGILKSIFNRNRVLWDNTNIFAPFPALKARQH